MSLLQQLDIFELRPLITNLSCKLSTITEYNTHKQLLCLVTEENDIVLRYTSNVLATGTTTATTMGNANNNNNNNACNAADSTTTAPATFQESLKMISWFRRTNRVIHDVSFDPTGCWLLVLCFDNTLHIVPALAVVDRNYGAEPQQTQQQQPFSITQITSYIIPFVGPHECPNSKKCPNETSHAAHGEHDERDHRTSDVPSTSSPPPPPPASSAQQAEALAGRSPRLELDDDEIQLLPTPPSKDEQPQEAVPPTLEAFSHDVAESMLSPPDAVVQPADASCIDKTGNSQMMMGTSFMASKTCPFPLSVVWWQTIDGVNRAIIGYSDGSICFVGLSPNCPFVASTAIESGSVVKLFLCKDNTFESLMLLVTSSLKQQFKLLLEQKAIKYVYPGDTSPSSAHQTRDNDWQIVMPIKPNVSVGSEPASDSSQLEEDVFLASNDDATTTTTTANTTTSNSSGAKASHVPQAPSQMPPPPPYSVAINRHADGGASNAPTATQTATSATANATASSSVAAASGVRFQQQQLSTVDDCYASDVSNAANAGTSTSATTTTTTAAAENAGGAAGAGAGILPAARARLVSLRSLGSKKFNAIKMRLTDNRKKMEEYMPENSLGSSFAIMDSPSLTPELLATSAQGSFYTIQNLLSTYLLSALHAQSNSLSVHSIDINLKPLFLYKIPRNCYDILISSNILYSIQYVDVEPVIDEVSGGKCASTPVPVVDNDAAAAPTSSTRANTEKENRDTDIEKSEKYTEEIVDLSDDDDKLMVGATAAPNDAAGVDGGGGGNGGVSSVETSATSSGPSINAASTATTTTNANNLVNAVGVISSAMASFRTGAEGNFNISAQLGLFRFEHETVISLYQMATYRTPINCNDMLSKEEKAQAFAYSDIHSPMDYVQFYSNTTQVLEEFSLRQMEIMQNEFPRINYDPCYVVTNKNVYYIQLKKEPFAIFLDAALAGEWVQCRDFCTTFDLNYEQCVEFAGDYLLRRKKVTQALVTYNAARIKPIRTALKLAMFGQTNALMHLCAMALKTTYTLTSKYFSNPILNTLMTDITYRHSEDVRKILPPSPCAGRTVNEGIACSDYTYGVDELLSNLQMSPSSQFHLANLLLITLAEKAVNDKNYLPLWNFLCTNTKFHTNMTSIVLCQSGLFSAALVLAKTRGVCIDTFLALTSVVGQEFGWYTELNVCLYNMSESIFAESITYVPHIAVDYFNFIQEKIDYIRPCVLKRLEEQLNPFSSTLRPIISHTSTGRSEHNALNDNNSSEMFAFCKTLIETYLAVLIHMESQRCKRDHIANALSTFRINYEDNQFAIETARFKPISAGCVHCACVVDGVAYFWGSNGVPCYYSANKLADPPEPAHAVKSLDLLSQLNLEVHTVKCGRQHSLVLTNNGVYAFGNNNFCQLGIGNQLQTSLQPMLIKAFDGKNITILEAGQYHNAAVADGQLYTWGWGVYGQLGHGDTEDLAEPKVVAFFADKQILQVSLGHAHSLVLCNGPVRSDGSVSTELYVFGSNHFGQLGIGGGGVNPPAANITDALDCSTSQVKSLIPLKLNVSGDARIRLIHTKFFTNLAVDEEERMYTWGSSPQALRLANQIKRRANAKQKFEENQRREMSKRFEATTTFEAPSTSDEVNDATSTMDITLDAPVTNAMPSSDLAIAKTIEDATSSSDASKKKHVEIADTIEEFDKKPTTTIVAAGAEEALSDVATTNANVVEQTYETKDEITTAGEQPEVLVVPEGGGATENNLNLNETLATESEARRRSSDTSTSQSSEAQNAHAGDKEETPKSAKNNAEEHEKNMRNLCNQIESCEISRHVDGDDGATKLSTKTMHKNNCEQNYGAAAAAGDEKKPDITQQKQPSIEIDPCEHMSPHLVDTSEVAGQILQISSGLFHHALISSTCTLYTWGKNLEHQLGTEDKERRPVNKPSPIDSIERPMYVDCGADFTLVMTTEFVVKAFGGNSNGQCGRDLGPSIDKLKQRVVCLPTSKRLMRFESQCVEVPVEINLPRPRIRLDVEPVRYLKSIPRYQPHFVQEAALSLATEMDYEERPQSRHYQSTTQAESSENVITGQDSDDLISSLENLSNNDASSLNVSLNLPPPPAAAVTTPTNTTTTTTKAVADEEPFVEVEAENCEAKTPVANAQQVQPPPPPANEPNVNNTNNNNHNNHSQSTITVEPEDDDDEHLADSAELQQLRNYIHYCLYVFHGLYNPDKVREFSRAPRLEYRIRTHMLNFKFIDAFTLCLQPCGTPAKALKLFEYFSKDAMGCVPMRRQDMKFLIYYLLMHFLTRKFDMLEAEQYFLADLDYYLLELAYVLYFNNNNTVLEQELNQKFKDLIAPQPSNVSGIGVGVGVGVGAYQQQQQQCQLHQHEQPTSGETLVRDGPESQHKLEDTDVIFDSLTVKFKTIVCQRLLKQCGSNSSN